MTCTSQTHQNVSKTTRAFHELVRLNVPMMVKMVFQWLFSMGTHTHTPHTHTHTHTYLLRPCGCLRQGTQSCGWGLGWSARPPRRWCLPGSKWRGRSGSSGTRLPAGAPCPPPWWPDGPRGPAGCRCPGGLAFCYTRPVSERDVQICVIIKVFTSCPAGTVSFCVDFVSIFVSIQ